MLSKNTEQMDSTAGLQDEATFQRVKQLNSDFSCQKINDRFGSQLHARITPSGKLKGSTIEECAMTAKKLYHLSKDPIVLCLSSGADSQALLQSFLLAKVPFRAAIMQFKNGFNEHDIRLAKQQCLELNIPHSIVDIDIIRFFESGTFIEYGKKYQCQSPQLASHLWLFDQVDGTPVASGNFYLPTMKDNHLFWFGMPGDLHGCLFRYFLENDRPGEPWFFQNRSEVLRSFLSLPVLKSFSQRAESSFIDEYSIRCLAYQNAGFDIIPQEAKQTGFEVLRKHYDHQLGTKDGKGFDAIFRRPLEKLNPFVKNYTQIVPEYILPSTGQPIRFKSLYKKFQDFI